MFGPIPVEQPAEPKPKRTALDAVNPRLRDWRRYPAPKPPTPRRKTPR